MKKQIFSLALACAAGFVFTGCASTRQSASLTAEQAKAVAMGLANDEALKLYNCQPFREGQPARFEAGHWIWIGRQGYGNGDIQATVELAADASAHKVDINLLDSRTVY